MTVPYYVRATGDSPGQGPGPHGEASNQRLKYVLLPDIRNGLMDRAAHGFSGRQEELFGIILEWLKERRLVPQKGGSTNE